MKQTRTKAPAPTPASVVAVYLVLTTLGLGLVLVAGMPLFEGLIHTLAAISTGGFSGFPDSLARLDEWGQIALAGVACLGALPLPLYWRAYARGSSQIWRDPELRALGAALGLTALLLWWLGHLTPYHAVTQAVYAQTTTGFSTLDVSNLEPSAKWVLILSMAIGGGVGSTAGGIKLLRVLILIRVVQLAILRVQVPRHAVFNLQLGGRSLESDQIEHALLLVLLFSFVIGVLWVPFLAAGCPPLDALFDLVSAVGTVGLSTGIASPDLEPGLKLLLSLAMLLGRVEILALLVLVYPGTWHK
jgi:trk system potassium uptake protein TrkH